MQVRSRVAWTHAKTARVSPQGVRVGRVAINLDLCPPEPQLLMLSIRVQPSYLPPPIALAVFASVSPMGLMGETPATAASAGGGV